LEVGIRQAKNNLSKLIDAVRNGEEVILTNRGERVAKLKHNNINNCECFREVVSWNHEAAHDNGRLKYDVGSAG
jgi:antitoxin (DNA-binding transcriptional repressor) of toxin-antitoxin stability system